MTNDTHLELIRREICIGDVVQIRVCGPGQEGKVVYLGELLERNGLKVRGPYGDHDLYWGDILALAPVGVPIHDANW